MPHRRTASIAILAAALLAMGGCWSGHSTTRPADEQAAGGFDEPQSVTVMTPDARTLVYRQVTPKDRPDDPATPILVYLDVYDIQVPVGAISTSVDFAGLVDQSQIPAAARQILARNGIRAGLGNHSQWNDFRAVFAGYPATTTPTRAAGSTGRAELMIRRDIPAQTLFYVDSSGDLVGRTYDQSENFWALRFHAVPLRPGLTSVGLCPVVRASRQRMEYASLNGEVQIKWTQPEALYEVGLNTELPLEKFLVIWPSPTVRKQTTSLGNAFLLSGDYPRQMEHIMVLCPIVFQYDEKATARLKAGKSDK